MEKQLPLKLSLWLKCNVVKNESGVNVWRATHENFSVVADADTPEDAAKEFGRKLQLAENELKKENEQKKSKAKAKEAVKAEPKEEKQEADSSDKDVAKSKSKAKSK